MRSTNVPIQNVKEEQKRKAKENNKQAGKATPTPHKHNEGERKNEGQRKPRNMARAKAIVLGCEKKAPPQILPPPSVPGTDVKVAC